MIRQPTVPPRPLSDLVGQRLGAFELLRPLGAGAMGVVFLAKDHVLRRDVAMKLIAKTASEDAVVAEHDRFLREARAAARLLHPHVVQIFQIGETDELRYIAMEYVPGLTALELAKRQGGRLPVAFCMQKMREAADALSLAESLGICHQDIKPANLLLTDAGSLKIADFGLAAHVGGSESIGSASAASIQGTPYYMSPEQWRNDGITTAADIYCLGATFFRLLAGMPPYGARDLVGCLQAHCHEPVPDPRERVPGLDPQLADLLMQCMAKRPADRPRATDILALIDSIGPSREVARQVWQELSASLTPAALPGDDMTDVGVTMTTGSGSLPDSWFGEQGSSRLGTDQDSQPGLEDTLPPPAAAQSSDIPNVTARGYLFSEIRQPTSFWSGGPYGWALRTLVMQLTGGCRAATLLGPAGSGRTFLCEMLAHEAAGLHVFRIEPGLLFGERFLVSLCRQYGLDINTNASMRFFVEAFLSQALPPEQPDAVAVVAIDCVDPDDTELARDIADILRSTNNPRLALLLVGAPDLGDRLAHSGLLSGPGMESSAPPVLLRRMTSHEMAEYIAFRVTTIGGGGVRIGLDASTQQLLHARSEGSPRLVNIYCHNALVIAVLRGNPVPSFEEFRLAMKSKAYLTTASAQALLARAS
jgi:serine/threonine protein kinase/type II secretory pathway predicted ATPase ExeA